MSKTTDDRSGDVQRMLTNFALEGLKPDATDLLLQKGYVDGKLTLGDLLAYARAYAAACSSQELAMPVGI